MRKWHRWLVVFSAIFMIWIAGTGLVGQVMTLGPALTGQGEGDGPPPAMTKPAAGGAAGQHGPAADGPGPGHRHGPPHDLYHLIIDLHSGNYFGPFGKVISALMGAALLFFSLSGVWMYVDMFRRRKTIGRGGVFWH